MANPLRHTSVNLTLQQRGVQHRTDIINDYIGLNFDLARVGVDFHLAGVGTVGIVGDLGRERRSLIDARVDAVGLLARRVGNLRNLVQRHRSVGASNSESSSGEFDIVDAGFHLMGCQPLRLVDRSKHSPVDGGPTARGGARAAGAAADTLHVGIAFSDTDAIDRHA